MRTYLVKIRISGTVSWIEVQSRNNGHAKQLARAQFSNADILEAKPK